MGVNRRELLISAIAVATGMVVARPAEAREAVMTMEQARKIIGNRHKTFDVAGDEDPLTATQMRELVTNNTIYGVRHDDEAYVLAFHPQDRCVLKMEDQPTEYGRWWVDEEEHTIHSQWPRAGGGKVISKNYFITREPGLYRAVTGFVQHPDGSVSASKYGMFLLRNGLYLSPSP